MYRSVGDESTANVNYVAVPKEQAVARAGVVGFPVEQSTNCLCLDSDRFRLCDCFDFACSILRGRYDQYPVPSSLASGPGIHENNAPFVDESFHF